MRIGKRRIDCESNRDERKTAFCDQEHRPPVDRVGDGAADDGRDQQRAERRQVEQCDLQSRVGQLEQLDRHRDPGDLAGEP